MAGVGKKKAAVGKIPTAAFFFPTAGEMFFPASGKISTAREIFPLANFSFLREVLWKLEVYSVAREGRYISASSF